MAACHIESYDDHKFNISSNRSNFKLLTKPLACFVDVLQLSDPLVSDGVSRGSSSNGGLSASYSKSSKRSSASRASSSGHREHRKSSMVLRHEIERRKRYEPTGRWRSTARRIPKSSDENEDTMSKSSDYDTRRRGTPRHPHRGYRSRMATKSERRPQGKDLVDRVRKKLEQCSVRSDGQSQMSISRRDEQRGIYVTRSSSGSSSVICHSRREKADLEFRRKYDSRSPPATRYSFTHLRMNHFSRELYPENKGEERSRHRGSSESRTRTMRSHRNVSELLPECRLRNIEAPGGRRDFEKWFQTLPPNVTVDKDLRTDRGIFRKDNFRTEEALDRYLGIY